MYVLCSTLSDYYLFLCFLINRRMAFFNILCMFVSVFYFCCIFCEFSVFVFCGIVSLLYVAVSFLLLYKSTHYYHQVETQLQ
jgi:hypothetical protein